jgi:hypothetical protein
LDGSRFDGIIRALATGTTQRRTLLGLAGSALAGLLGQVGMEDASAACIKPGKKGCNGPRNRKCCQGATCQGGSNTKNGRCTCKSGLKQCGNECVNLKKDKENCGNCKNQCAGTRTCKQGKCTSKLGCRAGQQFCGNSDSCPGATNPDCVCLTDVHGTPHCVNFVGATCSNCTRNVDCGPDMVCIRANFGGCNCDVVAGSNGNACTVATCDGISGS